MRKDSLKLEWQSESLKRCARAGSALFLSALAACSNYESGDDAEPAEAATVYVTEYVTPEGEVLDAEFSPSPANTVDIYRVHNPGDEATQILSNEQIRHRFWQANRYISYDLDGQYQFKVGEIKDVSLAPDSTERGSGDQCYTEAEIIGFASLLKDEQADILQFISDDIDLCRDSPDEKEKNSSAAFAYDNFSYYALEATGRKNKSYYTPQNIIHEAGHMFGLPHLPEFACESMFLGEMTRDNFIRDISEIVDESNPRCGVVRNEDGSINMYSSDLSIMGAKVIDISSGLRPAFSTLDRHMVNPEKTDTREVSPVESTFELSYTEQGISGVEIVLPEDHPAKRFDTSVDRVVVTVEVVGGSASETEMFRQVRDCDTSSIVCDVNLYLSNADHTVRYEIPNTHGSYVANHSKRIVYLDKTLGIGISVLDTFSRNPRIQILPYNTSKRFAERQNRELQQTLNRVSGE